MKTHKVLDLTYHEDEGQSCFVGSLYECEDFLALQGYAIGYKIVPMTNEEIENYQDNKKQEARTAKATN